MQASEYKGKIDNKDGLLEATEKGYMQREIQDSAYYIQRAVGKNEQLIVGVVSFQVEESIDLESLEVIEEIARVQRQKLAGLRKISSSFVPVKKRTIKSI